MEIVRSCSSPEDCWGIALRQHAARAIGSKKAGVCPSGKYTELLTKLVGDAEVSCHTCARLLESKGYKKELASSFVPARDGEQECEQGASNAPDDQQTEGAGSEQVDDDENLSDLQLQTLARKYSAYYEARLMWVLNGPSMS